MAIPFEPVKTLAPTGAGSFGGQTARNTTAYPDPVSAALKQNASSSLTAAPKVAAPNPYAAQTAKQTTAYPSFASGGGNSPASSDPIVKKIQTLQSSQTQPPSTGAASGAYDLSTDPGVQAQLAANKLAYDNAVANAQATAKGDVVNAGFDLSSVLEADPSLASTPLGAVLLDSANNAAAAGNPYSTAAQLLNTHTQNQHTIDQNENDANLFYSSDRANKLGQETAGYQGSVASAKDALATALGGLIGGLATEQMNENDKYAQAVATARQNAITNAIASGQTLAGYDANGNPIFNTVITAPSSGGSSGEDAGPFTTGPDLTGNGTSADLARYVSTPNAGGVYPAVNALPVAIKVAANKSGGSANKTQGLFAIH